MTKTGIYSHSQLCESKDWSMGRDETDNQMRDRQKERKRESALLCYAWEEERGVCSSDFPS